MKKRFFISLLTFCLICIFSLTAWAEQTDPVASYAYNLLAVSVSGMETNTLTSGVGDALRIRIYATGETLADDSFTLQYDDSAFAYTAASTETYDGKLSVTTATNANGSLTFSCTVAPSASFSGRVLLATVYFDTLADVSQTAFSFSLTDNMNALSAPVSVQITHRHAFGSWELLSVSEDGKMQKQKRTCIHCDVFETREIPYIDYSIALKADAKNIKFDVQNKILYQIAPGTTVGTLLDSLTSAGDMQVIDKKGNGKSRNDTVTTGMLVLVMDEGEVEATAQYIASVSVWGDADEDGNVSATDARLALRYSVGLEKNLTDMQILSMDSNADNEINSGDARFLLRVSVHLDAFYAVPVTQVLLNKTQFEMIIGQRFALSPTILPADATIKNLQWKSSDTAVASVTNGTVTANGVGTAVITATAASGAKATCTVTVTNPVRAVTNKRTNCYLPENGSINLNEYCTIVPAGADTQGAVWTSTNSAFTVTDGIVKCTKSYSSLSNKTSIISCKFPGGKTTSFKVTLIPAESTYCLFSYEFLQVKPGQQFRLSGKISASAVLKLVSSDTNILAFDSNTNVFTAKKAGIATVTCQGVDYSETVTIYVMSENIRVLACSTNKNNYDLTISVKNTATQTITRAEFYISATDTNGTTLPEAVRSVKDMPATDGVHTYRWPDVWDKDVDSASITKIVVTFADGHIEEIPAGCWYTSE